VIRKTTAPANQVFRAKIALMCGDGVVTVGTKMFYNDM
ncbi:unnamed protein product, partial [Acidithrix sp. C25]